MKLFITDYHEQNPDADINNCNNGGGYFQPYYEGLITHGNKVYKFIINNTSCGEFFQRFEFTIERGGKIIYSHERYENEDEDDYYSPITQEAEELISFIYNETRFYGYV